MDVKKLPSVAVIALWDAMVDIESDNHLYIYENTPAILDTLCTGCTPKEVLKMIDYNYSYSDKYVVLIDGQLKSFTLAYDENSPIDFERLEQFWNEREAAGFLQ